MNCPNCGYREADTEYCGTLYCEECAQALSDELNREPLDHEPEHSTGWRFNLDEIVRCF